MSKTIALTGMMGCGKSTYGAQLASKLKRPILDVDQLVEQQEGMTVSEIFKNHGEAYFRAAEWRVFLSCLQQENAIIATGGGLIPYAVERGYKKPPELFVIYLNPSVETLALRLEKPEERMKRPLLPEGEALYDWILSLHAKRHLAYLAWADAIVTNT